METEKRNIDLVVATGANLEKAEEKFKRKLSKKIDRGWTSKGEKALKKITYSGESVYMVYQIIKRD